MSHFVFIGLVAFVIIAIGVISTMNNESQNIAQINREMSISQQDRITELVSLTGEILGDKMTIINQGNDDIKIIQIRMYDDDSGNFVSAYPMNLIITGNTESSEIIPKPQSSEVSSYSLVAVTSNGVEFPIINNNKGDDGASVLDGIGVYLTIQNRDINGVVYFGNENGEQTDIRPYVEINSLDDWATVIQDNDSHETLSIPEFGKQYSYNSGKLEDVTKKSPNILGHSTSKITAGSPTLHFDDNGMTITGTGTIVLKLDSYTDDMLIRGTLDNADVKFVTSPIDLTTLDMSGKNFVLYRNTSPSVGMVDKVGTYHQNVCRGGCSGGHMSYLYYFSVTSSPNLLVAVDSDLNSSYDYNLKYYSKASCGSKNNRNCWYTMTHSNVGSVKTEIFSKTVTDGLLITSLQSKYTDNSLTYGKHTGKGSTVHTLYSTAPWNEQHSFDENFEKKVQLLENSHIVITVNDGSASIKGETFNPEIDAFLQIDDLPKNTAFDISKDGITGVIGQTDSNGRISLLYEDVDFGIITSMGGILNIYPNSLTYNGDYGIIMFDVLHGNTTRLQTGENMLYIPQNFVYWVFPVDVVIDNLRVDDIYLDYLNGSYTENKALLIPVIPSATTIYITINGEDVVVLMRDVDTSTNIKQVPKESSTSSDRKIGGTASTSSNISTSAFLTATHTGNMYVNFDFKVGGSADFTMDSKYTGGFDSNTSCKWHGASSPSRTHSCRTHSTPSSPDSITNMVSLTSEHQAQLTTALNRGQVSNLTVEVDIIKNMSDEDAQTILIYKSYSSKAFVTSTFYEARYGASNQVFVTYPLDMVTENIFIPVQVGDMVEFIVRVNLEASGTPAPISDSANYLSYVKVTTEFGGGIITVGMS